MKIYRLYYITFLILFSIQGNVCGQTGEATINGFVRDSVSGEALIGTNILLYKDSITVNKPPFRGAATNSYGFYSLPKLSKGPYYLIARNIGYRTSAQKINIAISKGRLQLDINMVPQNIKLKEVIVEGKKKPEINPGIIELSPDILKKLPSINGGINLFKALELLPGIKTESEISSGLYVRGGSPDQNLTLVDGVIIYNPSHLGNFASTFNSDAIQSVRLIKGAFPAEYGGRLSSVLDIKLRSGTKERNKAELGIGLINSHLTLEGPLSSNSTYLISGRKMYYDFVQKQFIKSSFIPRYNFYDFNSKIIIKASKSSIYTLSGLYSNDNLYNPSGSSGINYNIGWKNIMADFTWLYINSKSFFVNNSLSFIDYEFQSLLQDNTSNAAANNYYSVSKLRDFDIKTSAEFNWINDNTFKMGYDITYHDYFLIYSDIYDPLLDPTLSSLPDITSLEASIYFENTGKITNWLQTNIGMRGYYFKSKKFLSVEPRLSARFLINENLSVDAAYAIAHQFLHLIVRNDISLPTDLWYPSSDKVSPSKSTQYVAGINYDALNRQYMFSIEGYYKNMKNLYEFKNSTSYRIGEPISDLFTEGEGEAYGIEFFANKTTGNLSGWIGYTLSWTRRKFSELNNGKIFFPRYDRRHDISVVLAYKFNDNWNAGLTWTYATGQGFTMPTGQYQFQTIGIANQSELQFNYTGRNSYRLPPYHKLDLNFSYTFHWSDNEAKIYLNLFNVYNRQNPFAYYPTTENVTGNSGNQQVTELNQISLFPFIPSIGINVKF